MFTISPPSHSFWWNNTIALLLRARRSCSSPLSRQILPDVINQQLPNWIRKHKSASLLYGIGQATRYSSDVSWEHGIELFTHLDKIMVEMCTHQEGVDGLDERSAEKWRKLRTVFIQMTIRSASTHLKLSVGYFDTLEGHGPVEILPQPSPHSPSSRTSLWGMTDRDDGI